MTEWESLGGRRILVTGHTGFMGSWLVLWLHRIGAEVTGYALDPPTTPSHYEAARLATLLTRDLRGDIRDATALGSAFEQSKPEVVFHLAAQPLVQDGLRNPVETFDVNVVGTATLCDVIRGSAQPCAAIVATSDKCYRNLGDGEPFQEGDPLGGHDPYSASKAGAELVVAAYRTSYFPSTALAQHGVTLTSVRAGNVVGGGDWAADRLVPDAVRAVTTGQTLHVRNPASLRPWQHVLDPLSGYLTLAARTLAGERASGDDDAWNFGPRPGTDTTVSEFVDRLYAAWGTGEWALGPSDPTDALEAPTLRISPEKARNDLGWNARWDLPEATARTVAWYRSFYDDPSASMQAHSLKEIQDYENAVSGSAH